VARVKSILLFLFQSVVVGLAVAFVLILLRPELLPILNGDSSPNTARHASYADAVDISAPAVANVYTRRLVQSDGSLDAEDRFQLNTSLGSAVVIGRRAAMAERHLARRKD
jgi:S1-C subfamily serine protease